MKKSAFFYIGWIAWIIFCGLAGYIIVEMYGEEYITIGKAGLIIGGIGILSIGMLIEHIHNYFKNKSKNNGDKYHKDNKNKIIMKKSASINFTKQLLFGLLFVFACFTFGYIFGGILYDVSYMVNLKELIVIDFLALTVAFGCYLIIHFKNKNKFCTTK